MTIFGISRYRWALLTSAAAAAAGGSRSEEERELARGGSFARPRACVTPGICSSWAAHRPRRRTRTPLLLLALHPHPPPDPRERSLSFSFSSPSPPTACATRASLPGPFLPPPPARRRASPVDRRPSSLPVEWVLEIHPEVDFSSVRMLSNSPRPCVLLRPFVTWKRSFLLCRARAEYWSFRSELFPHVKIQLNPSVSFECDFWWNVRDIIYGFCRYQCCCSFFFGTVC